MKVLIVDDNEATAAIIQQLISSEGRKVRTAKDGTAGYWEYLDFKPDLVITDIEMPGKTGLELMKEIRAHNPCIRTIYMSGNLSRFASLLKEERRRHRAEILGKPFSIDALLRAVTKSQHYIP